MRRADLNSDGRPEIIALSMGACDNAGCPVTAIREISYQAASGESLAIQWEVLCKGAAPPVR